MDQSPQDEVAFGAYTRLAYQSARNEHDWDVYVTDGQGHNAVNLSNHPSHDVHPRLDRGGNRVVFASNRYGAYDIYVAAATGGGAPAQLTNAPGDDIYPAWSPDGTRIAFMSDRDGQPEVYVMNADGSGQTRVTYFAGLDGQPAWSPDGARLTFVRQVGATTHIWVMNADGSDAHEVAAQPFGENPAWSPDGTSIAYDADGDGDGWMELWRVPAEGGAADRLFKPPYAAMDAWMGSWSPDSRYVLYTAVEYVQYEGEWYWLSGAIRIFDVPGRFTTWWWYPGSGADWRPSVESIDLLPPDAGVQTLPAFSPFQFPVAVTGADAGPAGVQRIDVQFSIDDGPWTDWRTLASAETTLYSEGVGGQQIAFRARATDRAGNVEPWPGRADAVTRIESEPPVIRFRALPEFTQGQNITLGWTITDPGGSGVSKVECDVQDAAGGEWQRLPCIETALSYSGDIGATYRFRVRATDGARNEGSWTPADAMPQTTLYEWSARGTVVDNGGAAVSGAAIALSSPLLAPATSGAEGRYAAYTAEAAAGHVLGAGKTGYGTLPDTLLSSAREGSHDIVLPPADNIIADGGFDAGLGQWVAGGSLAPAVSEVERHSGAAAARLGPDAPAFRKPFNVTKSTQMDEWLDLAVDADGGARMLWWITDGSRMYGWLKLDGSWGTPPIPTPRLDFVTWGALAVTPDNTTWLAGEGYAYGPYPGAIIVSRAPGEPWSAPQVLTPSDVFLRDYPRIEATADGGLVVAWRGDHTVHVAERDPSGGWHEGVNVATGLEDQWIDDGPGLALGMGAGHAGEIHVIWNDGAGVRYACKTAAGAWQAPRLILPGRHERGVRLAVDATGAAHVVTNEPVEYATGLCDGGWGAPVTLSRGLLRGFAVDKAGTVSVLGQSRMDNRLVYYRKPAAAEWQSPALMPSMRTAGGAMLATDDAGIVHLAWVGWAGQGGAPQVYYSRRGAADYWEAPVSIGPTTAVLQGAGPTPFYVEGNGRVHATWEEWDASTGIYDLFYARRDPGVAQTADTTLTRAFTVPIASTHPGLSFTYRFSGSPDTSEPAFAVMLAHDAGTAQLLGRSEESIGWRHQWLDLAAYAGQAVQVTFAVQQPGGQPPAWAVVDDVTVGSTYPDAWVALAAPATAAPGGEYALTLDYGNRGAAGAEGASIALRLPAGVTLVSADPPPVAAGAELRWEPAALPAGAAATIRVRVRVDAGAARGAVLGATASIAVVTPELEGANNSAATETAVDNRMYVPVLAR